MKKYLLIVVLGMLVVSVLSATTKYEAVGKSTAPTVKKITGIELHATPSSKVAGAYYRPATRQAGILFVEDPAALGPPRPDQYWTLVLDNIVGSGNYGWYAVDASQTANGPDLVTMQGYDLVIWDTYDTWNSALGPALTATDQTNIANYISGGGKVWLIGQDILWSGVPLSWMTTNFDLQSAVQDYNGASGLIPYPVAGAAELSGLGFSFLVDWGSDVFADALTPTANAHQIIQDVAFPSYYPSIVSNDYTTSFWTVDGRNPNPWVDWEQIVYIMLDNFGVLGGQAVVWDFETGWQGWTHTNGAAFPAGWSVEAYDYQTGWECPSPGDSSFWVDSDASGGVIQDTAWSPAVVPPSNMSLLVYGYSFYSYSGYDWLAVGVRTFSSGAWNAPVALTTYTADAGPDWDSLDVSPYAAADSIRVYFYYDGDYDWWAAFDNVGLYPPSDHDVGCTQITSPPVGNMIPAGDYDVIGRIQNFGDNPETFDVVATVYDTLDSWNVIFTQTVAFTDFPVDGDSLHDFGVATFFEDKVYYTEIYTTLSGDVNPGNDTTAIFSGTTAFDFIWNFETGWQGWTHTNGLTFPRAWDRILNPYIWPDWVPPDAGTWSMWIDSDSAGISAPGTRDTALSPTIVPDVSTTWLRWGVGYWNLGSQFMDVGVKYFNGVNWAAISLRHYSGVSYGPDWDSVDVSAYNTYDSLQIFFYFDDMNGWNWLASFDNVMIDAFTGIAEEPGTHGIATFGFAATMPTMAKGRFPISYVTTMPGRVSLKVYDRIGRLVQTLVDEHQTAGEKSLVWNGIDINSRTVPNGVYFLRLEAQNEIALRKLVLLR
jgi:hypothetical protein